MLEDQLPITDVLAGLQKLITYATSALVHVYIPTVYIFSSNLFIVYILPAAAIAIAIASLPSSVLIFDT